MKHFSFLVLICLFLQTLSYSQDTLRFQCLKNPIKEIKVPLSQFNIKVKTKKRQKLNVLVTRQSDSLLFVRVKKTNNETRKRLKDLYTSADTTKFPESFTYAQYDSVIKMVKYTADCIQYPDTMNIALKELKSLSFSNVHSPSKRKKMRLMNLAGFVLVPAVLFVNATENPIIIAAVECLAGAWAISAVAMQSTHIQMKKWKALPLKK